MLGGFGVLRQRDSVRFNWRKASFYRGESSNFPRLGLLFTCIFLYGRLIREIIAKSKFVEYGEKRARASSHGRRMDPPRDWQTARSVRVLTGMAMLWLTPLAAAEVEEVPPTVVRFGHTWENRRFRSSVWLSKNVFHARKLRMTAQCLPIEWEGLREGRHDVTF